MRFWDASALVPLVIAQPRSDRLRSLLSTDPAIVCWWGTWVECASAVNRLVREGEFSAQEGRTAVRRFQELLAASAEVIASDHVRLRAIRLLAVHPLRASDALQLAAAIEWCRGHPVGASFVCLDTRLCEAAAIEGFEVLP